MALMYDQRLAPRFGSVEGPVSSFAQAHLRVSLALSMIEGTPGWEFGMGGLQERPA
jgi:hypothetical protein